MADRMTMTPEERAVAVATLRFAGMHPDWIKWFSRDGDEHNLRWVVRLMAEEVTYGRNDLKRLYQQRPDNLDVRKYLNSLKEKS